MSSETIKQEIQAVQILEVRGEPRTNLARRIFYC